MAEKEKDGIPLSCYHPDCGYSWVYGGRFHLYATCPGCQRRIKINKAYKEVSA